jgi:protease-4
VSRGRNMSTDAVHEIAQGRAWTGETALELGLVDHLGDLEQAIEAASRVAKIDDYSIWYVEPEISTREELLRTLMSEVSFALSGSGSNPGTLLMNKIQQDLGFLTQLNDPRGAYVICGSCPLNP